MSVAKGLRALVGEQFEAETREIPLGAIERNERQPRQTFDESALAELAGSIKEHGVIQAITVRPLSHERYEIVAGERRWRAARLAGLKTIPARVVAADDKGALEIAIVENVQRQDIAPMECAVSYRRLQEEFKLSTEAIAKKVGKSRASVANTMRLLKLAPAVRAHLEGARLSEGHARALLGEADPGRQEALAARAVAEGWNVRRTEREVENVPRPRRAAASPYDPELARGLSERLGAPCEIAEGRITVRFSDDEDLARLLEVLGG